MKKTILSVLLLLATSFTVQATSVPEETTLCAAVHFWNTYRPATVQSISGKDLVRVAYGQAELPMLHLFEMRDGNGFVILSADDCVRPVLAYSFDSPLTGNEASPTVTWWLQGYNDQIAEASKQNLAPSAAAVREWDELLSDDVPYEPLSLVAVPPMLTTRWDQSEPYNKFCPTDSHSGHRAVVGCVATAMAQIMKYWNYPSFGQSSHTYDSYNFGTQTADFENTTYLWQFMHDFIDEGFSPDYAIDAIAILSYHCGVAVEMSYGTSAQGGSGAYSYCGGWATACATNAFTEYFKYAPTLHHVSRHNYNDSDWTALLDDELTAGRPIYYSGYGDDGQGGHAFIIDGSDTSGRYHVNWGWSGSNNGYYLIDTLAPGSGGAGGNATYNFSVGQGAIIGIQPGFVETFDTVDYYDSVCTYQEYKHFREYALPAEAQDTLLRHLDTVFNYHLAVIASKNMILKSNNGEDEKRYVDYCPNEGATIPECPFSKDNCVFTGWCRQQNGDGEILRPGQIVFINTNRTYYAQWRDTINEPIPPDTLGIDQPTLSPLAIYPNPATDKVTVNTLSLDTPATLILLFDPLGRTLFRYDNPKRGTIEIPLRQLPTGAYTLQVRTSNNVYNQRIIKQ